MLGALVLICIANSAFASTNGCRAMAQFPCLPGLDAIGVGYDAVRGTSFGVGLPIVTFNFSDPANIWSDPFGNHTYYSYADEAHVMQRTTQSTSHAVFRSVNDYISQQQVDAHASAGLGGLFKLSVDTEWARTTMQDGLHIVADSKCELGVYTITLKPAMFLQADPEFTQYVDSLPDNFDQNAYQQLINHYGTHYVSTATLGGRARMKTVISHEYFSHQSDSSINTNLQIAWGLFGGGGGGGSSTNNTDQQWRDSASSVTYTEGGDPAIKSFNSADEWTEWAKSVDTGSPVVTSVALEPIWTMINDGQRKANVIKAIQAYASNASFPHANVTTYVMDWCDCYSEELGDEQPCDKSPDWPCRRLFCQKPGYFPMSYMLNEAYNKYWAFERDATSSDMTCCRPCFTAKN